MRLLARAARSMGLAEPWYFFFNHTRTPPIYTLSLHDALPISVHPSAGADTARYGRSVKPGTRARSASSVRVTRSEEHTSELQSQSNLVCRLLLEKKKSPKRSDATTRHHRTPSPLASIHSHPRA